MNVRKERKKERQRERQKDRQQKNPERKSTHLVRFLSDMEDYINSYCWSASTYVIMDREYNAFRRFKDTDVLMYNPKDRLSMMRGKFDELGVRWKSSDVGVDE